MSVAVGIAVDDTICLSWVYQPSECWSSAPVHALAGTYSYAGRAIVTTTIILSAQFMILISSQFQPTVHFGLLTSIGRWVALVFDRLFLPSILILLAYKKNKSMPSTASHPD